MTDKIDKTNKIDTNKRPKLHHTLDEKAQMDLRDSFALLLLQKFASDGYPAVDPEKQVDAAYLYAGLMVDRRKQ